MAGTTSAFSHEIPVGGCYLRTSPCTSTVGTAGWADFPLSSVLGLLQLPSARHVPEAAATESATGRHCLVSHALLITKFTYCSRIPLTVPGMHNLAQSCVKKATNLQDTGTCEEPQFQAHKAWQVCGVARLEVPTCAQPSSESPIM